MKIRNNGAGIRVVVDNAPINIPDGTDVIITKVNPKKSEILINIDKRNIATEVKNSILSDM